MSLTKASKLRRNFGITPEQETGIKTYLQGAVYAWVRDQPKEVFAARDLLGGPNFDWNGTPLYCLYVKHRTKGKDVDKAVKEAGKDAGWLLKAVLTADKRTFESHQKGLTKGYSWVGNEA